MNFKSWVAQNCPSLQSQINACYQELVDGAAVVDIDFANTRLSEGRIKSRDIATFDSASKSRCRAYFNIKEYDGQRFPHFVFQNFRAPFSDAQTGKAVPSVVNVLDILFKRFLEGEQVESSEVHRCIENPREVTSQITLVNEQRRWYSKLKSYGDNGYESQYFRGKGISADKIVSDELLDIRLGYSPRYKGYSALPLRPINLNSFSGFQRIFDTGAKIMMREFDPTGLCFYFATDENALEPAGVSTLILQEGAANALLTHFMSKEIGLVGVANVGGIYADNLPNLARVIESEFPHLQRILHIYDNDSNLKGKKTAKACQAICPRIKVDCFDRNDIADVVSDFSYDFAKKRFAVMLRTAFG